MNAVKTPRNGKGKTIVSALGEALVGFAGVSLFFGSGLGKAVALLGPGPLVLAGSRADLPADGLDRRAGGSLSGGGQPVPQFS